MPNVPHLVRWTADIIRIYVCVLAGTLIVPLRVPPKVGVPDYLPGKGVMVDDIRSLHCIDALMSEQCPWVPIESGTHHIS